MNSAVPPVASAAACAPSHADWLNDLSSTLPVSVTSPMFGVSIGAADPAAGVVPAGSVPAGSVPAGSVPAGSVPAAVVSLPDVVAVPASSSSSPPHAAATRPSAATSPTASNRLLLIIASPFSGIAVSQPDRGGSRLPARDRHNLPCGTPQLGSDAA